MWISIKWLRKLVDINQSPEELAETLTMAGFEVEEIENRASWADGVVVGKVLKCDRHPNADLLSVCTVDVGAEEPLNIVCGAQNVRADIYVPVATVGTYLPKVNLTIKPAKLRGVSSFGMICSLAELGLAKESAGIHIFSGDNLQVGSDARPLLGLDDVLLDLTATANRADALSMVGVAREVAALTGATVRLPKAKTVSVVKPVGSSLRLNIQESQGCTAYIGTLISGVKVGHSPAWLQQRLEGSRIRPVNNVVDVTNYVLLEWGQPLHAFDADKLRAVAGGDRLTVGVRFAQPGETLKTLDGQNRQLPAETLLITANDRPVALAGVMGGESTSVDGETQNILLEAALFDAATIRKSARSQGLRSESSNRYERGVNQAGLEEACRRAIALILELAGGEAIGQEMVDKRTTEITPINLRLDRVNQVLGSTKAELNGLKSTGSLPPDDIERILNALGCQISPTKQKNVWSVTVPPYRAKDLEREIDLIEEIARLYGYDNFCETLPSKTAAGGLSVEQQTLRNLRAAFRGAGLTELMHYSLVKPGETNQIELANPLFAEYSALRTQMLSGLIDAFQQNQDQGNGALNGFEIGRIFWKEGETLKEKEAIAGIMGGDATVNRWVRSGKEQRMTWYEAKGLLDSIFERMGIAVEYRPWGKEIAKGQSDGEATALSAEFASATLHPGRTASLWLWGKCLGVFGQLHPQLRQQRELIDEVYIFQLDLGLLVQAASKNTMQNTMQKFAAYSTFPASDRDLAFFSPVDLSVADLQKVMLKAGGKLLESVQLFDEYKGKNVPEGQRSLAFRLVYRASDRTLTDQDIEPIHNKVRDALVKQFNLTLRS